MWLEIACRYELNSKMCFMIFLKSGDRFGSSAP